MSSDWLPTLNSYLFEFEKEAINVLNDIAKTLAQSGQKFDSRIKEHVKKSVLSRLDLALDFLDFQNNCESQPNHSENEANQQTTTVTNEQMTSDISNESIEFFEADIKVEAISSEDDENAIGTTEGISTTFSHQTTNEAEASTRMHYRPSLDSCFSVDRHSTCSPSTSNQPMVSPIVSPSISPFTSSFEVNLPIKLESNHFEHMQYEECVVKMEEVPSTSVVATENKSQPSRSRGHIQRPLSQTEANTKHTDGKRKIVTKQNEPSKKPKIGHVAQVNDASSALCTTSHVYTDLFVFTCDDTRCQTNFYTNTLDEVFSHWKSAHEELRRPFRFMAVGKGMCAYCNKFESFQQLQCHHKYRHNSEIMVILDKENKSKCGLCHQSFSFSEMVVHFKNHHDPSLMVGITNPICLSEGEISEILKINSTSNGLIEWNSALHGPNEMKYFQCGHCNETKSFSETSLIEHIEADIFQYGCSLGSKMCPTVCHSISDIARHEETEHHLKNAHTKHLLALDGRLERYYLRTRVIFKSGLTLFKNNLLCSKYDDREEFRKFKERFIKQKSDECKIFIKNGEKLSEKHRRELSIQRSYRNNVCIRGLTTKVSKDDLHKIFNMICKIINVNVTNDDYEAIFQRSRFDVIIKLRKIETKSTMLRVFKSMKEEKTNIPEKFKSLLKINPNIDMENFSLENDLTGFFWDLAKIAQEEKNKMCIHSWWIADSGLNIKVTFKTNPEVIWSKADLLKSISQAYKGVF